MRRTKEEAEITRKKIIKVAFEVFLQEGYSKARLEEVAKKAGVTRGAIYWHFGDKYRLFISLLELGFSGHLDRVSKIIHSEVSPLTKIRELVKAPLTSLLEDEAYRGAMVLYSLKWEFTHEKHKKWETLQKQQKRKSKRLVSVAEYNQWLRTVIKGLIVECIETGEIRSDVNPELTSFALASYIDGVQSRYLIEPEVFKEERIADRLVDFVMGSVID
ncbi:MAG: TetR family transcriptional regulator [Deltaproteobacteria bacterium]|nr:TetR family transcriptional regulator [Deltaproteobacteria bacterium]MBW2051478.1 TetR family transcriptional regulator [Deltaproteobacteria bacterium]MBW2140588.1 TetR family transcriptional regulator [Deltaproteobacteria bacterium]